MKSQIIGIREFVRDREGVKTAFVTLGLATFDPDFSGGAKGETITVQKNRLDGYQPKINDTVIIQRGEARNYNGRLYQPIEGIYHIEK